MIAERESLSHRFFWSASLKPSWRVRISQFLGQTFPGQGPRCRFKEIFHFKSLGLGQGEFTLRVSRFYSAKRGVQKAAVNKLGQVCYQFVCSFRLGARSTFLVLSFFLLMFVDVDPISVQVTRKYPATLTWKSSVNGFRENFSCGTQRVVAIAQDSAILHAWIANHRAGFYSKPCNFFNAVFYWSLLTRVAFRYCTLAKDGRYHLYWANLENTKLNKDACSTLKINDDIIPIPFHVSTSKIRV